MQIIENGEGFVVKLTYQEGEMLFCGLRSLRIANSWATLRTFYFELLRFLKNKGVIER